MAKRKLPSKQGKVRGQTGQAKFLTRIARQTARLWRRHHLTYDQTKHVVERARGELHLEAPRERRRSVDRLDPAEVERLIEAAYAHCSRYGFMLKMLFYTGARVSEFVQFRIDDLHLTLDPAQIYIAKAKGGSDGYVPLLPAVAQELRTYLDGRETGYVFESNRLKPYTTRYVQPWCMRRRSEPGSPNASRPTVFEPASQRSYWMLACPWIKCRSFFGTSGSRRRKFMPKQACKE